MFRKWEEPGVDNKLLSVWFIPPRNYTHHKAHSFISSSNETNVMLFRAYVHIVLACREWGMYRVSITLINQWFQEGWDNSWNLYLQKFEKKLLIFKWIILKWQTTKTNKLHGLSPRANYTDRATAAYRRSDCQLVPIEGATWSEWRIPTAVFSVF
jgi:hypothetical protein